MAAYQFVNSKGVTYYLHKKDVVLRGDRAQTIYFFSKQIGGKSGKETPLGIYQRAVLFSENSTQRLSNIEKGCLITT